jgi:hypothetical protein
MAIINTYPSATPKGADLLIGTQVKDDTVEENSTKSFTVDSLGSYIVTSTSGITGSGTENRLARFTSDGSVVGDSYMIQSRVAAVNIVTIDGGSGFEDRLVCDAVQATDLYIDNITAEEGGTVIIKGDALIGDGLGLPDSVRINSSVLDNGGNSGASGQILVSNASSQLEWDDATDIVSGAVAKLIPFQITASAGGSSTYSADNNIVEIGWTGGNGTYVLNIPSATTIPYRNIRFVTNSTFPNGASDKVQITAQSGETIDGAAFFEISKVYEGVSLWSNGTEWIVIQAKAH